MFESRFFSWLAVVAAGLLLSSCAQEAPPAEGNGTDERPPVEETASAPEVAAPAAPIQPIDGLSLERVMLEEAPAAGGVAKRDPPGDAGTLADGGTVDDGGAGDAGPPAADAGVADAGSPDAGVPLPTAANPAHHELIVALATWRNAVPDSRGLPATAVYLDDVRPAVDAMVQYWTAQLEGRVTFTVRYAQARPGSRTPVLRAGPCDAVGWGVGPNGTAPGSPVYEATNKKFVLEAAASLGYTEDFIHSEGRHFIVFTRTDAFDANLNQVPNEQVCTHVGNSFTAGLLGSLRSGGMIHAFYDVGDDGWTVAHELGHNLGFSHANASRCSLERKTVRVVDDGSRSCAFTEYANPYSVMGNKSRGSLDGVARLVAGLTDAGSLVDISRGGSVTLAAVGTLAGLRFATFTVGTARYLAEYRAPVGADLDIVSRKTGNWRDAGVQLYRIYDRSRVPHPEWTYHLDADPAQNATSIRSGRAVVLGGGGRLSVTATTATTATISFDPAAPAVPVPAAAPVDVVAVPPTPAIFSTAPYPEIDFGWSGAPAPGEEVGAYEYAPAALLTPDTMGGLPTLAIFTGPQSFVRSASVVADHNASTTVVTGACNERGCRYSTTPTTIATAIAPVWTNITTALHGAMTVRVEGIDRTQHRIVSVRWCNRRTDGARCSPWTGRASATLLMSATTVRSDTARMMLNATTGRCSGATCSIPAAIRARAGDTITVGVEVESSDGRISRAGGVSLSTSTRGPTATLGIRISR